MRALLVIGLTFAMAAPAAAAPFTPQMDYAYRLALQHWGAEPTGCTSIDFEIVDDMPDREGEATQPDPGERIPCHMYIGRKLASPPWFIRMCAVVRHEVGHLLGFGHSEDPRSIMYPEVTLLPAQCWTASLWLMNHPRRFG
jgi:hypothetical protein